MKISDEFFNKVLDSITEHIAVIDDSGGIQFVNRSWTDFGYDNACTVDGGWRGVNYLDECDKASTMGDESGTMAGEGIRSVIEQQNHNFYFEYPCHSSHEKRWFMMHVTPFQTTEKRYFVISHQNITKRKLAEEEARSMSRLDGLTSIPNRRYFDEFLHQEWKRCLRLNIPISLALLDLDHFKLLNDTYGHQSGDECLIKVGGLLKEFTNRPGDIHARYGGEEFALVWGNTPLDQANLLSNRLLKKIVGLRIQNHNSPIRNYLTASIGLAEMIPRRNIPESELLGKADRMLYGAKEHGRNRVES